jgi:hypothetical protein
MHGVWIMNTKVNSTDPAGITGEAYHGVLLFLVSFGIVGNISVIVWRCFLRESRYSLLSALIISLAAADLLFCMHFLFQEVLLFRIVFIGDKGNHTFTNVDEAFCLSSTFTFFVSTNSAVLTTGGIAANTLFTLKGLQPRRAFILFITVCWIFSLSIASAATSTLSDFFESANASTWVMSSNSYSLRIAYGCMGDINMMLFPAIACSLNAAVTVSCIVLYGCVIRTVKSVDFKIENSGVRALQVRLTIIVLLNIVCWWPANVLYWYSYSRKKNVFNGELGPKASEPTLLCAALVSAANPIIYTIASRKFFRCLCCKPHSGQSSDPLIVHNDMDKACCCKLFGRRKSDVGRIRYLATETNETEKSSLFPETDIKVQMEITLGFTDSSD